MNTVSRSCFRGVKCFRRINIAQTNVALMSQIKFYQKSQNYSTIQKSDLLLANSTNLTQYRFLGAGFEIKHDDERFFIETREGVAQVKYYIRNGVMHITHTGVPKVFRGHGVGKLLAQAALDYGVQRGLVLKITCHFVKNFVDEYGPQYQKYIIH